MAPHSSTFAQKIQWMEEPGRLQSMGSLESDTTERLHFHFSLSCIGEGNGNPLQCSCLENPRDGEAWWAAVYRVARSRTRLKRLSSSSSKIIASPEKGNHISLSLLPSDYNLHTESYSIRTMKENQKKKVFPCSDPTKCYFKELPLPPKKRKKKRVGVGD